MRRSESGFWAHRDINAEDPHLQYLRVDGYRPMEGDLDMDGYDILNVGTINGVDLESHASRHEYGGADEIDGYYLNLNYSPLSYTVTTGVLGEHIAAVDEFLQNTATKDYVDGYFGSFGWPEVLAVDSTTSGNKPKISNGDWLEFLDATSSVPSSGDIRAAGSFNIEGKYSSIDNITILNWSGGSYTLYLGDPAVGKINSIYSMVATGGSHVWDIGGSPVLTLNSGGFNTAGDFDIQRAGSDAIQIREGQVIIPGNFVVDGYTTSLYNEIVNIEDNNLFLNQNYTTVVAKSGGLTVNYLPTSTTDTVNGAFTAGVPGVSNPTVVTTGNAFSVGDLVMISDADEPQNNGLFEVLSHSSNTLTIRGVGTTGTVESFTQNQFVTDSTVAGTITKVNVSVLRTGTDGAWEVGAGNVTGITFDDLATESYVDGYGVADHASTHLPSGSDPLATASAVSIGASNSAGTAESFAKSDHEHAVVDLNIASQEQGSILYFNGSNWVELPPGPDGYVLETQGIGANPNWVSVVAAGGGEDNVGANVGGATGEVYRNKTDVTLNFKTFAGEGGIGITNGADVITIDGYDLLPLDGTRSMTGDLDLGSNDLVNPGTSTFSNIYGAGTDGTWGDVLFRGTSNWERLAAGPDGYVLTTHGAGVDPTWEQSGAGVTDHGDLTGLGDDDHTQYLLVNGTRAMTGNLNMGTNNITNVVDPVNPQDAATKNYVDGYVASNNEWSEILANGNTTGGTNPEISSGDQIQAESGSDLILATYGDGYTVIKKDDAEIVRFDDLGSPRMLFPFVSGQEAHIKLADRTTDGNGATLFIEGQDAQGEENPGGNIVIRPGAKGTIGDDGTLRINSPSSGINPDVEIGSDSTSAYISIGGAKSASDAVLMRNNSLVFTLTSDAAIGFTSILDAGNKANDLILSAQANTDGAANSDGGDLLLRSGDGGASGADGYVVIQSGTLSPVEVARFTDGILIFNNNRLQLVANPINPQDAATKAYVDGYIDTNNEWSEILANGNTSEGIDVIVNGGSNIQIGTGTVATTGDIRADDGFSLQVRNASTDVQAVGVSSGVVTIGEDSDALGVDLRVSSGNDIQAFVNSNPVLTLDGSTVDVHTQRIENVVDPVNAQDAATKNYVDGYFGSQGWAEVLAVGDVSGGTDPIISTGDALRGETSLNLVGADGSSSVGGSVTLTAGDGTSTFDGGDIVLTSGNGGGGSPIGLDGEIIFNIDVIEVARFASTGGGNQIGQLVFHQDLTNAGIKHAWQNSGAATDFTVQASRGQTTGGDLVLVGGRGDNDAGGSVNITGGEGNSTGQGGSVNITGGANTSGTGSGGDVILTTGNGTGGGGTHGSIWMYYYTTPVMELDGSTVDVKTQRIENVVNPSNAQDAATKAYIDGYVDNYLPLNGTRAMTGNLNMGTHYITGVVDPVNPQDAATKNYVDGYVSANTLTPPVDPDEDGYVPIASNGDLTYLRGEQDGYVLTWNESQNTWESAAPATSTNRTVIVEFVLSETVNNTKAYFFTWRSTGSDSTTGKRSSATVGLQNANDCSPFQVPFDATIIKAVLTVKGVGVQNGSVSYPVTYQTNLKGVDFTSESTLASINFSISNSYTVGIYSVGDTHFKGSTALNIDVNEGDMLGLEFNNGIAANLAGQTRMAFVTLVLEER